MNKSTIFDVAAVAKVSNATVSRALNNPDKVKPETREKILKAAKDLGYKANVFAKALASKKSTEVGIIVKDLARSSVAEMLKGILEVATTYGYTSTLLPLGKEDDVDDILSSILSMNLDGILYLNDEITPNQYKLLKVIQNKYKIPLVLVNTLVLDDATLNSVTIDYYKAAYEVTKNLIVEGRKNICLLTTKKRYPVSILREEGYKKAISETNLKEIIVETSGDLTALRNELLSVNEFKNADGVIASRDSSAITALNILRDLGKSIPSDVSIYGFQNTRYCLMSNPNLSCVNLPIYDLGAKAMKVLTDDIKDEKEEPRGQILLEHSIIKRGTTK